MPVGSIESVIYGVDDLDRCTTFFEDFGLPLMKRTAEERVFRLEEGSRVILRHIDDPTLPPPWFEGNGVRETSFSIDSAEELGEIEKDLRSDREVRRDPDGSIHFLTDCDMPLALRVFQRTKVAYSPDPVNAPDNIKRFNQNRRWRMRARPKTINHIVLRVDDHEKSFAFFADRLGFRRSDTLEGIGVFGRPPGSNVHHAILFNKAGTLGYSSEPAGFDHLCFGVEDIDEVFAGWNFMERRGYKGPLEGVGRHRIASAIFCYFTAPCGGSAEYGADTDYIDDSWIPRIWKPDFGGFMWTSKVLPFLNRDVEWQVRYDPDYVPLGNQPAAAQQPAP